MLPSNLQKHIDGFYNSPVKMTADGVLSSRGGSPRKGECELLAKLVLDLKPQTTIDWGLGDGAVAISIALAKRQYGATDKHITIDPFQNQIGNGVGLIQLREHGLESDVEFLNQRAEEFLVDSIRANRQFDFIFIDGDHGMGGKLTDAHLASRALKPGGVVCFHDSLFNSTATAIEYLVFDLGYELLDLGEQSSFIRMMRAIKHTRRLSTQYAYNVIPRLGYSVCGLRKQCALLDRGAGSQHQH